MPTQLSLLVYKGVPVDFTKYRHTALHVLYSDGEYNWLHVVGAHPFFEFSQDSQNPISEPPIAWIPVSTVSDAMTKATIASACASTPVRNGNCDRDWNCQNWVGEALTELVRVGCLTDRERKVAIGKMVEVILEAELEDVSFGILCVVKQQTTDLNSSARMECFSIGGLLDTFVALCYAVRKCVFQNFNDDSCSQISILDTLNKLEC